MIRLNDSPVVEDYLNLADNVRAIEVVTIRRALHATGADRRRTAKILGVSLRTLYYKLRQYGLGAEFPNAK